MYYEPNHLNRRENFQGGGHGPRPEAGQGQGGPRGPQGGMRHGGGPGMGGPGGGMGPGGNRPGGGPGMRPGGQGGRPPMENAEVDFEKLEKYNAKQEKKLQKILGNDLYTQWRTRHPQETQQDDVNVTGFDVRSGRSKMFKVARIERVVLMADSWEFEGAHVHQEADAFHMAGPVGMPVKLGLTLRARSLLLEEYPLSAPFVYEAEGRFFFEGEVRRVEGIGRFVTGLIPEIEILEGEELREYVHKRCLAGAVKTANPSFPA